MRAWISSRKYRYAYLLISLLLIIFVSPFLPRGFGKFRLLEALLLITLLAGALSAVSKGRQVYGVLGLAAATGIARMGWVFAGGAWFYAFVACAIVFYAAVALLILMFLMRHADRVSADTIYGALSVYLMLGIIWALAYALLDHASPGSFTGIESTATGAHFERYLGFSFTTLTTLGYGNVHPATAKADALANLQAVTGPVYLAVVLARLVAIQIAQPREP